MCAIGFVAGVVVHELGIREAEAQTSGASMDVSPRLMVNGFYAGASGVQSSGNRVTQMLAATKVYDFAATVSGCVDSTAIAMTGATAGDPCVVGYDQNVSDAGGAEFTCYTKKNAAFIRFCAEGPSDPLDGGYWLRVISSQ